MPLPRVIARMNKRYTNRFIEPVVARFGGYAVVHHRGRRSGRTYRTPLFGFDSETGLLIALTYGPSADWAKNVIAGGGTVERNGRCESIGAASVVKRAQAWSHLPLVVRAALRVLRVTDFLSLDLGPESAEHEAAVTVL